MLGSSMKPDPFLAAMLDVAVFMLLKVDIARNTIGSARLKG